jgi:hypothetical protein
VALIRTAGLAVAQARARDPRQDAGASTVSSCRGGQGGGQDRCRSDRLERRRGCTCKSSFLLCRLVASKASSRLPDPSASPFSHPLLLRASSLNRAASRWSGRSNRPLDTRPRRSRSRRRAGRLGIGQQSRPGVRRRRLLRQRRRGSPQPFFRARRWDPASPSTVALPRTQRPAGVTGHRPYPSRQGRAHSLNPLPRPTTAGANRSGHPFLILPFTLLRHLSTADGAAGPAPLCLSTRRT